MKSVLYEHTANSIWPREETGFRETVFLVDTPTNAHSPMPGRTEDIEAGFSSFFPMNQVLKILSSSSSKGVTMVVYAKATIRHAPIQNPMLRKARCHFSNEAKGI
jgi:hypothetical protein